jgi:hypothetical protein
VCESAAELSFLRTGVPHLSENEPHLDPNIGLCLGSQGDSRGVGVFSWVRYPCNAALSHPKSTTIRQDKIANENLDWIGGGPILI